MFKGFFKLLRHAVSSAGTISLLGLANSANSSPLITLDGPSPFATCDVSREEGDNYLNAEVEPWVDVNPADSDNLIAGWQQDRWSNGGARGLMSAYSTDGGKSWKRVVVPGIGKCSSPKNGGFAYDRNSDPWVTFAADGTAYFNSLAFFNDRPDGGGGINAILVNRSIDGGKTWGPPQVLIRDTDGRAFNDKNAMSADPNDAKFIYVVWDRLFDTLLPAARKVHGDAAADARDRRLARHNRTATTARPSGWYVGPTWIARSINGGASWEPASKIFNPGVNAQTIGNQAVVLNDATVLVFYMEITADGRTYIGFLKSNDHGARFTPGRRAVKAEVTLHGTRTPDLREPVRDANILFDVAIDRGNGNLYLVWQDGRELGLDRVAFSMSTDNGVSWSTPAIINKTPASGRNFRNQAFVPSVEVGSNGRVHVTYYDFRNDLTDGRELADYWAISCDFAATGDCETKTGWGRERRLTDQSFDMLDAPIARGHFLGDYMGLVKQGSAGVRAVFGIAVSDNVNQMVTRLLP